MYLNRPPLKPTLVHQVSLRQKKLEILMQKKVKFIKGVKCITYAGGVWRLQDSDIYNRSKKQASQQRMERPSRC